MKLLMSTQGSDMPMRRRERIAERRFRWLEEQSAAWTAAGLIDEPGRRRILGSYEPESPQRRSMLALVVLAVLIAGVGLLLLIGYNWSRIPGAVKIGGILVAVATAFGASAAAYRAGRATAGEALAFGGTLVFGNGIWLIAQVLHLQGHFPDAFLWFGIGALASAYLVTSRWIGIEAAILLLAWIVAESTILPEVPSAFFIVWPSAVVIAYRLGSPVMLRIAAFALAVSVAVGTRYLADGPLGPPLLAVAGCAIYAAGCWDPGRMRRAWHTSGLVVLLVGLVPLMIAAAQREFLRIAPAHTVSQYAVAALLLAVALSPLAGRAVTIADRTVAATAAAAAGWALASLAQVTSPTGSTIFFSALTLIVGVALIRTALRRGRFSDLTFGVLFLLGFLVVRWASVVENLFWSGSLLLLTGAGLLLLARLWRGRDAAATPAGGES